MAQNPYLQNLLGINQGGMGLYNYNYSLPNYNTLLSQGLTEDQIKGYDTGFNTFNQFPYKVQPNPNLNYPQYGVVPQAPGVDPITTEPPPNGGGGGGGGEIDYSSDVRDTVSTPYGDFTSDDFTQDIYTYPSNKPMNQMTEQELMAFGQSKGYIDEDGRLMGSMQVDAGKLGIYGNMISGPAQIMNDKKYDWFLDSLNQKGMLQGSGTADSLSFAMHSPQFRVLDQKAQFYNDILKQGLTETEISERFTSKPIKIPGTFKSVQKTINQYAPTMTGTGEQEVVYYTSKGGYYDPTDNKFVTASGQKAAFGSMDDAIETIKAAAKANKSIPSKFDQEWYDKVKDSVNLTSTQKNDLKEAWKDIKASDKKVEEGLKKIRSTTESTRDMTTDQHVRVKSQPKQKDTKKTKTMSDKELNKQQERIVKNISRFKESYDPKKGQFTKGR